MIDAALAETAATFSAPVHVLWSDTLPDRGVVVLAVETDRGRYVHQVVCLREGDAWHAWTSGPAPGWLEIDESSTVEIRCMHVEDGTAAVRLLHDGVEREVPVEGPLFFQAMWEEGEWPVPVAVLIGGRWEPTAFPGVAVTADHLIDRYVAYETAQDDADWWAWEVLDEAVDERPEEAWLLVREAIERAPSEEVVFNIAAGALENLVNDHGDVLLERIEAAARDRPKLRLAMTGVWRND